MLFSIVLRRCLELSDTAVGRSILPLVIIKLRVQTCLLRSTMSEAQARQPTAAAMLLPFHCQHHKLRMELSSSKKLRDGPPRSLVTHRCSPTLSLKYLRCLLCLEAILSKAVAKYFVRCTFSQLLTLSSTKSAVQKRLRPLHICMY